MNKDTAVILLGRGGYSNAPNEQMNRLVEALRESGAHGLATTAFIDGGSPALPDALALCAARGVARALVVPVYLPSDRNLDNWLNRTVRRWLHHNAAADFTVHMRPPLADAPELAAAVQALAARYADAPGAPLSANKASPNSPEWSRIPPHSYHALLCRGPRCNAAGSGEIAQVLKQRLKAKKMGDDAVLVAQTGCLYPCNLGPVMVVYPEGLWYGGLTVKGVERIVEEHFEGGKAVARYARYPSQQRQQRPTEVEQV
ncbi:MAG: NAD(P)H-dependent oxidoreductase subunit E [Chloroflexota bacterium]|nr:NAD(P)H-dependent oxidoreductase subunit E [Chloroflexota bacterium]MDE2950697.1 NAD(P)H-dependent oxidoreductase subunit E [Chloroflexota bacterium]